MSDFEKVAFDRPPGASSQKSRFAHDLNQFWPRDITIVVTTFRWILNLTPQTLQLCPLPTRLRQELSTLLIEESDVVSTRR